MKYIFSKGLYKEALRKTKALTVALLVISLCWTSFYFIGNLTDYTSSIRNNVDLHYLPYDNISSLAGILLLYIYVMGIGFALNAFSFLNKRNASDFFHGIPYSRYTLFFSNIIACATQILIIITANLLVPTLGCLISGIPLYYGFVPLVFLFCFVGSMFVLAACSIAMSITGTAFSNIVLCGLILFLPRFISTTAAATIMSRAEIVPFEALGFLLDPSYNIPVGLLLSGMGIVVGYRDGVSSMFTSLGTYLYTGVLFVVYTGIAAFLFARRKSEMATNSAPGKVLQCVYRCAVGLVFAIVTAMLIIFDEVDLATLFVAFLSLITYMLFELITTRSLKAMVKSLATYWIVIVVAVVFYFSVTGMSNAFLNDVPTADEIKTVQIIPGNNMESEVGPYKSSYIANAKLSDRELIKITSEQLDETVRYIKHDAYYSVEYDTLCVKYNLKSGRSLTRNIWVPVDELTTLNELLANNDAYVEAMKKLPKDSEIVLVTAYGLSDEQARLVFSAYRKEVQESDTVPELLSASDYFYRDNAYSGNMYISVSGYHNMTYFNEMYAIDANMYPQTAALYMEYSNEFAQADGAFDNMLEVMEGWYQNSKGPSNERHIVQVNYRFADLENAAQYATDREVFEENYRSIDRVYIDDYAIGGSYDLGYEDSQAYPELANDCRVGFYNAIKKAELSKYIGENTIILNVTLIKENDDFSYSGYEEESYMIWVDVSDEAMQTLVDICEVNMSEFYG